MINEGWKKLYDVEGNWIGMTQTLILTPEEFEQYNKENEKASD